MTAANKRRQWLLGTALTLTLAASGWVSQFDEGSAEANIITQPQPALTHDIRPPRDGENGGTKDRLTATTQRYGNSGMDLFATPAAPQPVAVAMAETAPAPVAPPLPFTYLGRMVQEGRETIFISSSQRGYMAHRGEVLENNYRIDNISGGQVQFTYLPLNITQTLEIGETQ